MTYYHLCINDICLQNKHNIKVLKYYACHDIAEKLLKLKLNTNQSINQYNQYNIILMCMTLIEWKRVTCTQYCTEYIYSFHRFVDCCFEIIL